VRRFGAGSAWWGTTRSKRGILSYFEGWRKERCRNRQGRSVYCRRCVQSINAESLCSGRGESEGGKALPVIRRGKETTVGVGSLRPTYLSSAISELREKLPGGRKTKIAGRRKENVSTLSVNGSQVDEGAEGGGKAVG